MLSRRQSRAWRLLGSYLGPRLPTHTYMNTYKGTCQLGMWRRLALEQPGVAWYARCASAIRVRARRGGGARCGLCMRPLWQVDAPNAGEERIIFIRSHQTSRKQPIWYIISNQAFQRPCEVCYRTPCESRSAILHLLNRGSTPRRLETRDFSGMRKGLKKSNGELVKTVNGRLLSVTVGWVGILTPESQDTYMYKIRMLSRHYEDY